MAFDALRVTQALTKMFISLPLPTANANPTEAARVYLDVCAQYSTDDIEGAVRDFIEGRVAWMNKAFAPTPPQFVSQVRKREEARNASFLRNDRAIEQLEGRDRDEHFQSLKTPATRAKVKAMAEAFANDHSLKSKKKTPEQIKREREIIERMETRIDGEFIEGPAGKVSKALARKLMES